LELRLTTLTGVLAFCLPAVSSFSQEASAPQVQTTDPVCGFIAGPHFYLEATQVKQGLSVELLPSGARVDQPATLRFLVNLKPRNVPVDKLQIEHEKFMHVLGVRDDLQEFFHLHPVRVSPGVWEVTYTFKHGGNYKLWTDVKYRGTVYSFAQPVLTVSGDFGNQGATPDFAGSAVCSGYRITFNHSAPLVTGATNQLQFSIQDPTGKSPELENYLGTPMHLVILKDDLSVYLHGHPERLGPGSAALRFQQTFTKPGAYKLFAQFRPKEAKLPADETNLAEFRVTVAPAATN
jgi:hypothetical protein